MLRSPMAGRHTVDMILRRMKTRGSIMTHLDNGTTLAPHGLFYMENAGGYPTEPRPPITEEEHQPSCFALEEERGEGWKGSGASRPMLKETRPTL